MPTSRTVRISLLAFLVVAFSAGAALAQTDDTGRSEDSEREIRDRLAGLTSICAIDTNTGRATSVFTIDPTIWEDFGREMPRELPVLTQLSRTPVIAQAMGGGLYQFDLTGIKVDPDEGTPDPDTALIEVECEVEFVWHGESCTLEKGTCNDPLGVGCICVGKCTVTLSI